MRENGKFGGAYDGSVDTAINLSLYTSYRLVTVADCFKDRRFAPLAVNKIGTHNPPRSGDGAAMRRQVHVVIMVKKLFQ